MDFTTRLDGYYLDILTINDNFTFSIAAHEYPFTNKNKLENIGEKTRRIRVKCAFSERPTTSDGWSPGLKEPSYENHYDFIKHIKKNQLFNFIHPKYGSFLGYISTITVNQDDTINYADVDFEFLVQDMAVKSYTKPIEAQQAEAFDGLSLRTLDFMKAAQKAAANALRFTSRYQLVINQLTAYMNSVVSPATSIANTIYYASDLPSQLLEAINFAVDRALQPILAVQTASSSTINNLVVAATQLANTITDAFPDTDVDDEIEYIKVQAASRVAYETAVIYEEDNSKKINQDRRSEEKLFDENGNYIGSTDYEEIMTINELDNTCYNVKTLIDDAVQLNRENIELKEQGMLLQKYINQIKLNRERIITEEDVPMQTFHQIAIDNDLNYHKAEQLLKLNPRIKNPTFAVGELKILSKD